MIKQRNLLTYFLLSLVTCGIYHIVFMYSLGEDMNKVGSGDGENTTNYLIAMLLSIVTCGIYLFIWYYKLGNRMQANGPRYGVNIQDNGTTVLLWMVIGSLICGIGQFIGINILIKNMNTLGDSYNSGSGGGQSFSSENFN